MTKLNLGVVSLSLAVVSVIVYIICGIFYILLPDLTISYFNNLIHSSIPIQKAALDLNKFLLGLVEAAITAAVIGAIFVPIYNYFVDLLEK